ncbi:hypothetical protein ACJJTC_009903 [Scirpophaga incertulas]
MTPSTSTIFEDFTDENYTTTEDTFSTESFFSTTEIDNVTEISFFEKKNQSTTKITAVKNVLKNCKCDLKYNICDINCCCDSDCSENFLKLFVNCENNKVYEEVQHLCNPFELSQKMYKQYFFENVFCIVKTNLPQKRNINFKKFDIATIQYTNIWHQNEQSRYMEFQRKSYVYGDNIWVLKEGVIWYLDMPWPVVNNYCSGRKSIVFLKDDKVNCDVNIKDLEMFQVLKTSKEAFCISVTDKIDNSSILNCSTLYCTNWTIRACNGNSDQCIDYNTTLHEPSCTDTYCTNIALRLDYVFYYYDSKITSAVIQLYTQNISNPSSLMTQEINIKFLLTNNSKENIIETSGSLGYYYGMPVLSSMMEKNHSSHFFNITFEGTRYFSQPRNKEGYCIFDKLGNIVNFGINRRLSCKYFYDKAISTKNITEVCNDLENDIKTIFELDKKTYISPLGNPKGIVDNEWILVKSNILQKEMTYGQYLTKSRLRCFNLLTRISYVFAFVDISEISKEREFQIVDVSVKIDSLNVTFSLDDISTVLIIDTNFVDVTKLEIYEYAGAPHLNIHLPRDFFFPFPSNGYNIILRDFSIGANQAGEIKDRAQVDSWDGVS